MDDSYLNYCCFNNVNMFVVFFLDPALEAFPHALATALFSFLYHLASYETGEYTQITCPFLTNIY